MNDLLILMMVFAVLMSVFKKAAKAPPKTQRPEPRPFSVEPAPSHSSSPAAPAAAQPAARPLQQEQRLHTPEGESQPLTFAERMRSMEGRDPCHEQQLTPAVRPASASPLLAVAEETQPSISLDFTRDELLRAVVMQEVLTRPCERRNRRIG